MRTSATALTRSRIHTARAILRNIASVLCAKRPPSKLSFRADVADDSESDASDDNNNGGGAVVAAAVVGPGAGDSVVVNVKAGSSAEVASALVAENKSGSATTKVSLDC